MESKNIITLIKQMLMNYDLALEYAKGELAINIEAMELYKNSRKMWKKRKYIEAKIDKERFEIFIEEIQEQKNDLIENLRFILAKYSCGTWEVFDLYYLQDKSVSEIVEILKLPVDSVEFILKRLKKDILELYTL